jgi:hypothetical protein
MRAFRSTVLTLITSVLVVSCSDQASAPELDEGPLFSVSSSAASVLTFGDMIEVGSSTIVRNDNGVSVRLSTSELEPGTAFTMWLVVFNKPENCDVGAAGCDGDDVVPGTPAMVDVINVGGSLVGGSGKATVAAHQQVGEAGYSVFQQLGAPSPGLVYARDAELHLVVRTHGPAIPGLIYEMTHTFAAGCDGFPPVLGTPGPNTCDDLQFAVHLP